MLKRKKLLNYLKFPVRSSSKLGFFLVCSTAQLVCSRKFLCVLVALSRIVNEYRTDPLSAFLAQCTSEIIFYMERLCCHGTCIDGPYTEQMFTCTILHVVTPLHFSFINGVNINKLYNKLIQNFRNVEL